MTLHKAHMVILWLILEHTLLICWDIVQMKLHFPQIALKQTFVLVLVILMINAQNYYTLKLYRNLNKTFQPAFLLHCHKEFIRFLCECIVNLFEGDLTGVTKNQFACFQKQLGKLRSKLTTLCSRRLILGSKAGTTLLIYIYQPCKNNFSTFFF